jgi:hypothetical protein
VAVTMRSDSLRKTGGQSAYEEISEPATFKGEPEDASGNHDRGDSAGVVGD